ncbi:hypothetical protein B7P43_G14376 [Cryptotermes secundus]|uniref:Uncharacterized protein n=1 Tax=Cryptotermes secundus TaxID=105785 RepID=A0A2J7Q1P8_9NEOP|nr:hypothetical protein B7P43_G14376 [Cryptotermes secundus]
MESVSKCQIKKKNRHVRECSKGTILEGPCKNIVKREEKKKRLHKKKKREYDKQELIELEHLRSSKT